MAKPGNVLILTALFWVTSDLTHPMKSDNNGDRDRVEKADADSIQEITFPLDGCNYSFDVKATHLGIEVGCSVIEWEWILRQWAAVKALDSSR